MYYVLRYCKECAGRANPYNGCYVWNVHQTQIHGLWINHQGGFAFSSKYSTNRAWLCTWSLGMCTRETSVNITLLLRQFGHLALSLSVEQKWIYLWLYNFLIWNHDREAYNKVKIKNSLSKSPMKQDSYSLIMFCPLQQTQCPVSSMRQTSYQHWLVAMETSLPLWISSCFPSPFVLNGQLTL